MSDSLKSHGLSTPDFSVLHQLLISWLQSPSAVILELKKINSITLPIVSPFICHGVMGPDAMILTFWMLNFKPDFSLSYFNFIKRIFSSSLLSAIWLVSSAYLRLLIFLPALFIPAFASSSPAFHIMYSAYKLNIQGDNIQPWWTPFPNMNQSVVSCIILLLFLDLQKVSQEADKLVWYSHLLKNFPVCCDLRSQRL